MAFSFPLHWQNLRTQARIRAFFNRASHVRVDREKHVARYDVAQHDDPVAFDFRKKSLLVSAPVMVRHLGQVLGQHLRPLCSSLSATIEAANRCGYNSFAVGVRT